MTTPSLLTAANCEPSAEKSALVTMPLLLVRLWSDDPSRASQTLIAAQVRRDEQGAIGAVKRAVNGTSVKKTKRAEQRFTRHQIPNENLLVGAYRDDS